MVLQFTLHIAFLLRSSSIWEPSRSMTLGRTLWVVILVKLFIIFAVLKLFFFPNYIGQHAEEGEESEFVASEMLGRTQAP